jgi:iron uptake system component EfeO
VKRRTVCAAAILLAAGALASCGDDNPSGSGDSGSKGGGKTNEVKYTLTDKGCSPANSKVAAGPVKISVQNPDTNKTDELELKNKDGIIMGERENIAPGLSAEFTLTLKPGTYVLNCTFQNDPRDNGKLTVTGSSQKTASAPTTLLSAAVEDYKRGVKRHTRKLVKNTTAFVAALDAGDVKKAQDLFGPTRLDYEAVEPIAESFGDLDPEIDARVNDVAKRSDWTGFHRIEQILFEKSTTRGTAPYGKKLLADVKRLDGKIDGLELQPAQIANGAVGLLDEVSASKITGEEDRYSHTDLSDFQGNFDGAREAFQALEPALQKQGEGKLVSRIESQMTTVQKGLDRYKRNTPLGFAEYSALTKLDRRQFAQQITALAEPLSQVAGKVLKS